MPSDPHATKHGAAHGAPPAPSGAGYETRDIDFPKLISIGIVLIVGTALSMVVAALVFTYLAGKEAGMQPPPSSLTAVTTPTQPPEPRLQTTPVADLKEYRAKQEEMLTTYGWVDRKAGLVRIPIDRAIEVVAQRGLPVRVPEQAAAGDASKAAASSPDGQPKKQGARQ
jgi:hypothetical protein